MKSENEELSTSCAYCSLYIKESLDSLVHDTICIYFNFRKIIFRCLKRRDRKRHVTVTNTKKTRVTFRKITFKVDISEPFLAGNSLSLIMRLVEMFRMFSGYDWYDPKKSKDLSSFNT